MNIETQFNNRCVARGFSTMRIVLGMDGKLPVEIVDTKIQDIVRIVGKEFPNNEVYVWCHPDKFLEAEANVHYCGDYFETLDDTKYIIGFAYFGEENGDGHFVVGWPVGLNNILGLMIAVKENNEQTQND